MKSRSHLFILLLLIMLGCQKPVELDLPEFTNQPVVNCFFNNEEPFAVYVSKTAGQFDSVLVQVDDAQVRIFNGDRLVADLPLVEDGTYSDSTVIPEIGVLYTIKVNVPGYPEVSASDSIPSLFSEFTYKSFKEKAWYSEDGMQFSGFTFQIDDQPGANFFEVHYRAELFNHNKINDTIKYHGFEYGALFCFDPVVKEETTEEMFTDRTFDGKSIDLELMNQIVPFYLDDDSVNFVVQVIEPSASYYRYRLIYDKHSSAQYSDFFNLIEPVVMYSNIENGYGIFAGYRSKFYRIDFRN